MFIPIKDDVPTIRTPYVTIALIVINSLVFLFSFMQGREGFQMVTWQYGYIPIEFVQSIELTPQLAMPPMTTVFTSMFMHGGWLHLIGNMLFLWIYGNNVEDYFGPIKFIIFYLVAGMAAVALFTLFSQSGQIPLVGASGAIAGVMGAYMVLHPKARITLLMIFVFIRFITLPAKVVLGIWIGYQVLMSLAGSTGGGGVAWLAHVGGFLFGWGLLSLLVRFFRKGPTARGDSGVYRVKWN